MEQTIGGWNPRKLQAFVEKVIQQQGGPASIFDTLETGDLIISDQLSLSLPAVQTIGETMRTPSARVYDSAPAAVTNATWTTMDWDTRSHDTTVDTIWNSANTDRFNIAFEGNYVVVAQVNWPSGATGDKFIRLTGNWGTTHVRSSPQSSNGEHGPTIVELLRFAVGDYVQAQVYQASGGNLTPVSNANMFAITRIG